MGNTLKIQKNSHWKDLQIPSMLAQLQENITMKSLFWRCSSKEQEKGVFFFFFKSYSSVPDTQV